MASSAELDLALVGQQLLDASELALRQAALGEHVFGFVADSCSFRDERLSTAWTSSSTSFGDSVSMSPAEVSACTISATFQEPWRCADA